MLAWPGLSLFSCFLRCKMAYLASSCCSCSSSSQNFQGIHETPAASRQALKTTATTNSSSVSVQQQSLSMLRCNIFPPVSVSVPVLVSDPVNGGNSCSLSAFYRRQQQQPPNAVQFVSAGSRMAASIRATVSDYPVVMYTKSRCPYGIKAKALFDRLGVEVLVIELNDLGPIQQQIRNALKRLTSQSTVPYIFIGGKFIGGCSDTMLLHRKGELLPLLEACGLRVPWYQETPGKEEKLIDQLQLVA